MSNQPDVIDDSKPDLPKGEFLGHPKALWQLFNIELWERFAYYGMRALLAVYVADAFFGMLENGDANPNKNAEASLVYGGYTAMVYATGIAGGYIADQVLGYQRSILLGAIIMAAGLFMLLIPELNWFLIGLALIVAGNGLFKPNISTMIGQLYSPGDVRRDSGFTIFYMGINLGALLAPLVTGTLIGAYFGFKWGFFAAGIGMILSTVFLEFAKPSLGKVGLPPEGKESWNRFFAVGLGAVAAVPIIYFLLSESAILGIILLNVMAFVIFYFFSSAHKSAAISALIGLALWLGAQFYFSDGEIGVQSLRDNAFSQMPMIIWGVYVLVTAISLLVKKFAAGDKVQAQRYIAMVILFVANACFWSLFEQAGSSLNFLARDFVTPIWGSMESWQAGGFAIFQSLNPLFILIFAPLFAMLWPVLDKKGINPSIPRKFALGLLQVGLGFGVLIWAIANFQNAAGLVPWIFLGLCYLLHTTGELCLSPIGLSMVTKLAAPKEVGLAMGGWFLSIAMAQYVAGIIAAIASGGDGGHGVAVSSIEQYASTYQLLLYIGLAFGVLYLVLAPAINKLMHGVK